MKTTYKKHTIEIIKEFEAFTYIIDNRIESPGWAYRQSALEAAQRTIRQELA